MCVIIDACVRDSIFTSTPSDDAKPVLDWVENGEGRVAYGGTILCDELFKSEHARRRLRTWKQAGLASEFPQAVVDIEEHRVRSEGNARSNDTHILALARISGARTLYSKDGTLHADFKNASIINDPRGTIYQTTDHVELLKHTSSCRIGLTRLRDSFWKK